MIWLRYIHVTIWPQKVYDMIWLWYDMWMTDIYMLSYDMKYVMVWDMWYENDMKYDILWCNMLRYDMYMMKCYVKSMERYVMSPKLCVYNMI